MPAPVRVAVLDDQPLYREGVIYSLSQNNGFVVVGQGASAEEAVTIARDTLPDVMLLDLKMPGGGIEAARAITNECPAVKVVMLTVSEEEEHVTSALQAGASGYVLKGVGGAELAQTLHSIVAGEAYITPALAARLLTSVRREQEQPVGSAIPREAGLNRREEQILELLSTAMTNREIAERLDLSEKTVKRYMTNILQKLQARNRVEAALACANLRKPERMN